jgi:SpoIID/LytB domain protein
MRARSAAALAGLALALAAPVTVPPAGRSAARADPLPRVSFRAEPGASILVHGTYPTAHSQCVQTYQPSLHARFQGTIEVGKDSDGSLFVIGALPLEDYLKGIAEVPRTWPMEALKAQVVAARTYAFSRLGSPDATGARLGYQLCATDACQVYRGMGIGYGPYGDRWRKAVSQTAGQILEYDGRPADTLYFSTSNGHTVGNQEVFGSDPLPYLRPVPELDDGASPLSHWHMSMPWSDVSRFLKAGGYWSGKEIGSIKLRDGNVVVTGGGSTATFSVTDFRSHLDFWAPCLDPSRYPGSLPQTIPSRWFSLSNANHTMALDGRGWGHGVGMVQWGAEGKAARGMTYDQILGYYYGGLKPVRAAEPDEIRVGIAVGLSSVRIEGTGEVTVSRRTAGSSPWLVTGGADLTVRHSTPPPRYITAGVFRRAPRSGRAGATINTSADLPQLSVARLVLNVNGLDVPLLPVITAGPGVVTLTGKIPKEFPSGRFALQAEITNGIDIVRTEPRMLRVVGGTTPSPTPSPSQSVTASPTPPAPSPAPTGPVAVATAPEGGNTALAVATVAGGLVLIAGLFVLLSVRKRRRVGEASAP